jgi:large subunit ribosomal protein L6
VAVAVEGRTVRARGAQGELSVTLPPKVTASVEGNVVSVSRIEETREARCQHGLARSLVANLLEGVAKGYRKDLEIEGVGFKAAVQGQKLSLTLGFATPIVYDLPEGAKVTVADGTKIAVAGPDKQQVGDVAARIRSFYRTEPYKGKGIRYKGEQVRRKVGKTVA